MTQDEIDQIKARDGLYIIGWKDTPSVTHVVGVWCGEMRQILISDNELEPTSERWAGLEVLGGPITAPRVRAFNEHTRQTREQIQMLQRDLAVWHERALAAEAKLGSGLL